MDRRTDFKMKVDAIRQILDDAGFDGVEIKSQSNFSYVTRGRGFIGLASTVACASLYILKNRIVLFGENIDAQRMYVEQLDSNQDVDLIMFPWDEPEERAIRLNSFTKDMRIANESDLETELFNLRTILSEFDREDFKLLCQTSAQVVEGICKTLKPGLSEYELAGEIAKQLWANNIEPITILVAFDERALRYRHPVMTDNRLKNYALVGICGRRNGLIASVTRDVLVNGDDEMIEKHKKCARVNAAFWSSLQPGTNVSEIFAKGVAQYGVEGVPIEHKEHHQGGLTGFVPRELRASHLSNHVVRINEAYAFNPTIQGAKVEDTVLVTENGIEILTYTGDYAYETIDIGGKSINIPTVYVMDGY